VSKLLSQLNIAHNCAVGVAEIKKKRLCDCVNWIFDTYGCSRSNLCRAAGCYTTALLLKLVSVRITSPLY